MLCLIGQKLFSETTFITKEEMPPKPGDLIGFKLLNVFSNSLSCRILSPKPFFWGSYKFLKIFWSMCNRRCQFRTNFCKKYYWIHLQFYFDQNIRCRKLAFGKAIIDKFCLASCILCLLNIELTIIFGNFFPKTPNNDFYSVFSLAEVLFFEGLSQFFAFFVDFWRPFVMQRFRKVFALTVHSLSGKELDLACICNKAR